MTDFNDTIQRIGEDTTPIELVTTPARLFILISQIQLVLRHPHNTGSGAAIVQEIAQNMTEALCKLHPEARELIERGWDDTADMSPEQFEAVRQNDDLFDEIRITNASTLLQEYAKAIGRPVVLAANAELYHDDGIQPGNPATADLEPIKGLTFAIACDQFEAQVLIDGINTLLTAMPYMTGRNNNEPDDFGISPRG